MLRLYCAVIGALLLLASRPALANGRFPLSNQIVFSPRDPNVIVLRTSYGILQSHDNGGSWQYLCEDALGIPMTATLDPELGLTQKNTLVAAVTTELREESAYIGLDVSPDLGCTWNCISGPLAHQAVADVVVRPDAPDVVLAVSSTQRQPDAGGGSSSQVFQSMDDGVTWSAFGNSIDPLVEIQTIDVVRGDPQRVYLSGTRGVGPQKTASLFVSMNQGKDWTEHPLSQFDPNSEEFLWIAAIDPTNEDRVYLRSNAPAITGGKSRLYVTNDAGQSFQMALEFQVPAPSNGVVPAGLGEMLGFAVSADGSKLYAGSKEKGLLMASASDMNFQTVNSSIDVQCLATRGNELWACSDAKSGFIIGVSTDGGAHFCPKMREIWSITGALSCNAGSTFGCGATVNGSQCQMQFDTFCSYYPTNGVCSPDCPGDYPAGCPIGTTDAGAACDAGSQGGGSSGGGGGTKMMTKSSGCSSTSGGGVAGSLLAFLATLAVALKRRRTRAGITMGLLCFAGLGSTGCSKAAPEPAPSGMPMLSSASGRLTTTQNLRSVWGSSDSDLWVVGDKGTIEHFDGRRWSDSNSGTTEDLTGICGTASNDVWVSTQQGSVLHWDGSTWAFVVAMANTTLLSIWASGPMDVWAVGIATGDGDDGLIRHFNGMKWDTVIVPNSTSAWAITGTGPNEIWLAGSSQNSVNGFVLRGNGSHFDTVGYSGPSARGIWVIAPNDVWVAPYQGAMQHYDGSSWMAAPTTGGPLLRVAGSASGEVWAVGLGGVILHYQAGRWSTSTSGTSEVLWSVWSNGPNSVWAVGNSGTVLRWNGAAWSR